MIRAIPIPLLALLVATGCTQTVTAPEIRLDNRPPKRAEPTTEVTPPVPPRPGRPARQDYEYERRGTANLFMLFAPLEGWRHVKVLRRQPKGP